MTIKPASVIAGRITAMTAGTDTFAAFVDVLADALDPSTGSGQATNDRRPACDHSSVV
jgi:hypothetical protein